jgi:hypothetical protein
MSGSRISVALLLSAPLMLAALRFSDQILNFAAFPVGAQPPFVQAFAQNSLLTDGADSSEGISPSGLPKNFRYFPDSAQQFVDGTGYAIDDTALTDDRASTVQNLFHSPFATTFRTSSTDTETANLAHDRDFEIVAVPEPLTYLLLIAGWACIVIIFHRYRKIS